IAAIVDRRGGAASPVAEEARRQGVEVLASHAVKTTAGRRRVSSMTVAPSGGGAARTIAIDALLTSSGWTPSVHLFSQSRGKVTFDGATQRFLPGQYAQDCVSIGACNGTDDLAAALDEAYAAGEAAAKDAGRKAGRMKRAKVGVSESWSG